MELKTLNYLKVLIPGIIILAGFIPVKNQLVVQNDILITGNNYVIGIIALFLGAIYYQINLRWIILFYSLNHINYNIFHKILKICSPIEEKQIKKYWKTKDSRKKILNNIFYQYIDKDETLKQKTLNFYFNEIFWTSSADIIIISLIYFFLYYNNIWIFSNVYGIANYFLVFTGLAFILHIVSSLIHFSLSNEQLNYICTDYKEEITPKIEDIFNPDVFKNNPIN